LMTAQLLLAAYSFFIRLISLNINLI
jgi:hypothetical protein